MSVGCDLLVLLVEPQMVQNLFVEPWLASVLLSLNMLVASGAAGFPTRPLKIAEAVAVATCTCAPII